MVRSERAGQGLYERGTELASLEEGFKAAVGGSGGFAAIVGPAGIGKSSLLAEAADSARRLGMRVFRARATELERSFGFGVIRQLFDSTVRGADHDLRAVIGHGAAGAALGLLAGAAGLSAMRSPDALLSMVNSIYWLIANLSDGGPLVLIVDDLQWADEESVATLAFLQSRAWELPVAVVVASRSEQGETVSTLIASADGATLRPLSNAAIEQMIRDSLGEPEPAFTRAAAEVSGGNPFYLGELIAELAAGRVAPVADETDAVHASGPASVGRSVVARVGRLSDNAQAVARATLILGDRAAAVHIARFAGIEVDAMRLAASELVKADVFVSGRDCEFAHPIIRSALADSTDTHLISSEHARAAEVLELAGADPEVVATHVMAIPPAADPLTVTRLLRAAQVASGRGASGSAVGYLRRAVEEPPSVDRQGEVLLALGSAEALMQDPSCFFHLLEARESFPPGPKRAEAGLAVTRILAFAGEISMALAEGAKVRGLDRETDLFLDAVTMAASMIGRDQMGVAEVVARSEILAGDTPGERSALALAAFMKTKSGTPLEDVNPMLERVITKGGLTIMAADGFSPSCILACLSFSGQHQRGVSLCTQLIDEAERHGSPLARALYTAVRAGTLFRLGRLVEAAADARFSLESAGALHVTLPIAHMVLVESLIALGKLDEAQEAVGGLPPPGDREDLSMRASATWTHGHLLAELGDFDAGIAAIREASQVINDVGAVNPSIFGWEIVLADLLTRAGNQEQAREVAESALAIARRYGSPWALGRLLRSVALSGHTDPITLLTEAAEILDNGECPFALAETLVDLGAELRRSGQRRQAREPLARGLQLARECGAVPLAERAAVELHTCGASPRATVRIGMDSLTPSEWRVAQLAAAGQGNREIAQSLFVTEKTVEKHLGNAYRKLGITRRSQLIPVVRASTEAMTGGSKG